MAQLWELGTSGIIEETESLRAFFEDAVARAEVCAIFGVTGAAAREETPFAEIERAAREDFEPIPIGERFYVSPLSGAHSEPTGRIRIAVDSTNAFGTGRHESTQLCVEELERYLRAEFAVADVGCGSGILSAVAQALGVASVVSCDIHEDAAGNARKILDRPRVFVGSADGIRSGSVDLVVANLGAKILDRIASDLRRILKPEGTAIAAGFVAENPPKLFKPTDVSRKGDWECWVVRREDIDGSHPPEMPGVHAREWWL